jgi:hypothetical protein
MLNPIRLGIGSALIGATSLLAFAGPATVNAQPEQNGLVNVALVDTTIQVPIAVAANICDVNVNALAQQLALGDTACGADATATAVDSDGPGNSPVRQNGLVNIYAEDTTVQVPIGIAANLCDIDVNVLARQLELGERTCDAVGNAEAEA